MMFKVDIPGKKLKKLVPTGFSALSLRERFDIQEWIEKSPEILGEDLLVVAKEYTLASGKRLDLLCIDKEAKLVVIELKRDDSGQAVEWQAIKYASYCSSLTDDEIFDQYSNYLGTARAEAQRRIEEFVDADIENLNSSQRIILVSREFNSEVISAVLWLREYGVDIQCTRLAPFLDGEQLFIKPEIIIPLPEAKDYIERKEVKQRVSSTRADWTGVWFVNVGDGPHRAWEDNRKYSFVGAGHGKRYSDALFRLSVGDKFYAYQAGRGYVGYGEVVQTAIPIRDFTFSGKPVQELHLKAPDPFSNIDDDELCEYVVPVKWISTVPMNEAKTFTGVFANQNVVCKLRDERTLKFVQEKFGADPT